MLNAVSMQVVTIGTTELMIQPVKSSRWIPMTLMRE